ncbi:hypothetical protein ACIBKY_03575 [Nonomuraea sp. NPDC050394]|uniref:hypothetical protein n=1 Tax=Nonomuraea sp. NPDC050394 TaxID=3364363 RepID=UPI0037A656F7
MSGFNAAVVVPGPGGGDAEATYYRHRNHDFRQEIVVRAWRPGVGTLWGLTVTGDEGGFEPQVAVHVRAGAFSIYTRFPAFWSALAERQPGTLDEVARILDELGVADETADVERSRAVTSALLAEEFDTWRDGWEADPDEEPLPPDPHPDDYEPDPGETTQPEEAR